MGASLSLVYLAGRIIQPNILPQSLSLRKHAQLDNSGSNDTGMAEDVEKQKIWARKALNSELLQG
jgi:hypothetical protein